MLLRINMLMLFVAFAFMTLVPNAANAQGLVTGTRATFEQAIEIPGHVLPAGTYVFIESGNSLVKVWDEDHNKLVAALITNAAEQSQFAEERQEFEFEKSVPDKPVELKAWFRDGGMLGREFIYQK